MTTKELLVNQRKLIAEVDFYSALLKSYDDLRTPMGLIPDNIKATDDYKAVKRGFDKTFGALRAFNGTNAKQLNKIGLVERRKYR